MGNDLTNYYMDLALNEAKKALELDEVPVGAILTCDNKIIAIAHNTKESENDPLGHAELNCISEASEILSRWRLDDCDLYVTLEPCLMCAGAIIESRIRHLYIGTLDKERGAIVSNLNLLNIPNINHKPLITYGIKEEECKDLLVSYFKGKR